ncbi:Double Clp-N motif-containing P-loop nucleoside triphosphate hydrolases superfamily protein [Euphorbia peplus]|nr:Double Clp-N motif-containing P-loop nucleoside triphosphate hydrolases superfamily protein [Euphorbia peplus]
MPTPVDVARQCLTDEAARALDDAVAVARRRSHTQTTSLHAVYALLALPSSTLRNACARARNNQCTSRLQFHALELCVGVSLDRLPSSKTLDEPPPISNSLMAAIKRSQANQRRHPENFHLMQIHCNQQTPSVLKVELKHFILSILDDPIVSRVLGDAGFRSCDIKLAIIHPPLTQSRRCPPIFLCNLTGPDLSQPGFSFPFSGIEDGDENSKRIGEALAKRNEKGKNLLLLGVCAADALSKFVDCVNRDEAGVLPSEIAGLSLISIEKEISEFVCEGGNDKEKMGLKLDEVRDKTEKCSGPGIVLNIGELKALVDENACFGAVSYLVSKLSALLEGFRDKLWLMGAAARYEMYSKFLGQFPAIEKDWDLHLLPITSKSPIDGFGSKSGLMGSFVPLGGFFAAPSDIKIPLSNMNQSVTRCHLCTAKYEQEIAAMLKKEQRISVSDRYSENLPSWLQMAHLDKGLGLDEDKTRNDGTLNAKILGLQKKWNDICHQLHHVHPFSGIGVSPNRPDTSYAECFQYVSEMKASSSGRGSSLNDGQPANLNLGIRMDLQSVVPIQPKAISVTPESETVSYQPKKLTDALENQQSGKGSPGFTHFSLPSVGLPSDQTSPSCVSSVTTDLGLSTPYSLNSQLPVTPQLYGHKEHLQHFSSFKSAEYGVRDSTSCQTLRSSPSSNHPLGEHSDSGDYKSIRKALTDKVGWQDEAICAITRAISRCKAGYGRSCGSTARGDIWLAFTGPDKVGKKRIASGLAETMFGSQENLVSMDLSCHEVVFRGKTVVDFIAMELRKKPSSVVLLENVDKCDDQTRTSLFHAVTTGRFRDSHGSEVSTRNMIFVMTSTIAMGNMNLTSHSKPIRFSEESILGAKSWQMQILIEHHPSKYGSRSSSINVKVSEKVASNSSSMNKRKLGASNSEEQDLNNVAKKRTHWALGPSIDLNLPVEETEESISSQSYDSDSISESSQAWLEDFFDKVDEKVMFKPFDFDGLAEKITSEIGRQFQKVIGSEILLEIDEEVMLQILSACWVSDGSTMSEWIETVLGRAFLEAREKYRINVENVVKIATCEGVLMEEQAAGICLPSRITL